MLGAVSTPVRYPPIALGCISVASRGLLEMELTCIMFCAGLEPMITPLRRKHVLFCFVWCGVEAREVIPYAGMYVFVQYRSPFALEPMFL